jgi:hypothetical protein
MLGQDLPRRRVLALLAAILTSGALAPRVAAERTPAHGASIASRVQTQKESCMVDEGSFSERKTAFGSVITTCKGGKYPQTCVNTLQSTDCHKPFTGAPEDVAPPPSGGVAPATSGGGAGTWVVDGAASSGQVTRTATVHQTHRGRPIHGRSKKRRAGGKRRK